MLMIQSTIKKVISMQDLAPEEARDLMTSIADGNVTEAQIGSILTALTMKGVTTHEITAFAHVLRDRAIEMKPYDNGTFVDTCGTGGDGAQTFNISTAAALVAAAAGVRVVKHGNRMVIPRFAHQFASEMDHRFKILVSHLGGFLHRPLKRLVRTAGEFRVESQMNIAHC